jgi:hypothetical protein
MGWRAAELGWDSVLEVARAAQFHFMAPVKVGRPRVLSWCILNSVKNWGLVWHRGRVREPRRRHVRVGPLVPRFDLLVWAPP